MRGNYRGRRLFIRFYGNSATLKLPWPMTLWEAFCFFGILLAIGAACIIGGGWIGWALFEPSLWRLLPIGVLFLVVRFVIARPLLRALTPPDLADRRIACDPQADSVDGPSRRGEQ